MFQLGEIPVLEVVRLSSGYDRVKVLYDVSFKVGRDEVVGFIGSNGSGKTTLIKTILGYVKPWSGEIRYLGIRIDGLEPHKIAKLGIGYVPERGGVLKTLTVKENLELTASLSNVGLSEINEIYKLFPILKERQNQRAGTLSGGEQRMLSIAMALLMTDKLLILDEPSSGLAPIIRKKLVETLSKIMRERNLSMLISEQDPSIIAGLANRVYVLERGVISRSGSVDEILKKEVLREHYLGL